MFMITLTTLIGLHFCFITALHWRQFDLVIAALCTKSTKLLYVRPG